MVEYNIPTCTHTRVHTGIHTHTDTHTPTRTNTFAHFNHQSMCFVTTFIRHVRHPKSAPAPCVVVSVDVSVRLSVCRSACLCEGRRCMCVLCRCDCDTSRHLWCRQRQQQRAGFPIIQWEPASLADNQSHAPISILSAVIFNFIPLRFAKYL